jgi:hypothetical protein
MEKEGWNHIIAVCPSAYGKKLQKLNFFAIDEPHAKKLARVILTGEKSTLSEFFDVRSFASETR